MLLSVMILVGLKPQFPRLSPRARKVWLTLHVGISVGWLGLGLAMTTLAFTGLLAETHAVRHGAYELMHIFDLTIVIPSVLLSIITGLGVGLAVCMVGTPRCCGPRRRCRSSSPGEGRGGGARTSRSAEPDGPMNSRVGPRAAASTTRSRRSART